MNLITILKEEIESLSSNWNKFDQSVYIYIRTCKIFSYDPRFAVTTNMKEWKDAYYKKVSVTNVKDFEVTCLAWCRIYKKLLNQLLNIEVEIKGKNGSHRWCCYDIENDHIEADATFYMYNDLVRVKNNDFISGINLYYPNGEFNKIGTYKKIRDTLVKIGYNNNYLYNDYLFMLYNESKDEEILKEALKLTKESNIFECITKKYDYIKKTLNTKDKRITDVISNVKLLEKNMFNNEEKKYISRITMYQENPFSMKYLSLIHTNQKTRIYVTEVKDNLITMNIIDKDIIPYLTSHQTRNKVVYDNIKQKLKIK